MWVGGWVGGWGLSVLGGAGCWVRCCYGAGCCFCFGWVRVACVGAVARGSARANLESELESAARSHVLEGGAAHLP